MTIRDRIVSLERIKARDLEPHALNPRKHPDSQAAAVSTLLRSIGYADALLAYRREDGSLRLIDGHLRRNLTPDTEVPVLVTDLSEQEAAIMLAAGDPLAGLAERDDALMAELLAQTDSALLAELLESGGDALAALLGREVEAQGGLLPDADPDAIPEDAPTRCAKGELWALGEHRLLCGDSTKAEDVARLMGGERADIVLTDPPYGMNLDTDWSSAVGSLRSMGARSQTRGRKHRPVEGDDAPFDPEPIFQLLPDVREMFLWGADYYAERIPQRDQGSWLVWDKRKESQSDAIGSEFELCWSKAKHKRRILRHDWFGFLSSQNSKEAQHRLHPTQKPTSLIRDMLQQWGRMGEVVVDLYAGSGAILIACQQEGFRCLAAEIDAAYCDVILARYEAATGSQARRLEAG